MPTNEKTIAAAGEPYPGLRFYRDDDALFFAGREQDIRDCANLLIEARVLVLHGRTGCGKSSFLRAGVKPRVSTLHLGLNFSEGFVVIRSTADPLRALVTCVLSMTRDLLETSKSEFGPLDDFTEPEELREELGKWGLGDLSAKGFKAAVDQFVEDGAAFVDVLVSVASNMKNAPIFVIDQGEEVFTMAREGAGTSASETQTTGLTNLDIGRNEAAVQFFRFLHRFASDGRRGRIIVSLRTEYKGLFDDRITENGPEQTRRHPGGSLAGFFLKELEKPELKQAILRPTLSADSPVWESIVKAQRGKKAAPVAPFERFGFTIDTDVVDQLADDLLGTDIPYGGVLPTMQVACLRLWRQASRATRVEGQPLKVRMLNYRRLGRIGDQVEEFLTETIEDVCSVREFRGRVAEATQVWMHTLSELMVQVQADGRAVTRAVSHSALLDALAQRLISSKQRRNVLKEESERDAAQWRKVLDRLINTLLDEGNNILKSDSGADANMITLGHDSLALALRRWSIRNPVESMSMMMMRMGMGAVLPAEELRQEDLFLKEDPPHKVTVLVPRDYVWDRHLPEFALSRDFAKRLGIEIQMGGDPNEQKLNALDEQGRGPKNWKEMVDNIRAEERRVDIVRYDADNQRVLIAADWYSFPGQPPEDGSKYDERKDFAARFSDILVTNISVGNQLIGPPSDEIDEARAALASANLQKRQELLKDLIQKCLDKIVRENAVVYTLDKAGAELLSLAARFVDDTESLAYVSNPDNVRILSTRDYAPADPLMEVLLEDARDKSEQRVKYIIGSAYAYAMAIQCGFVPYFGTKALSELGKFEMERRQTATYTARQAKKPLPDYSEEMVRDITGELQGIVTHTLWQLGIEPTKWAQGLNRAMVLRLASVGYFTTEYARTNMDKFIAYVQGFVSDVISMEEGTKGKGARLTQRAIKEAIRECFHFLRFEEYGTEVYDLDARLAYWSDHGRLDTKSVAGEVYGELVRLRQKTIESFGHTAQAIAWMRLSGDYNPGDARVALAFRLKELAWNHFRIFNFYDSERYMSLSAHLLQEQMECKFRNDNKGGVLNSVLGQD